jgi:gluconolactonase
MRRTLPPALLLAAAAALAPAADIPDLAARLAAAKAEVYVRAPGYSEGPTWRDGELFFCSGPLLRVTKDRQVRKYLDIAPNGTYLCADGRILLCDNKLPALLELTPAGKVNILVEQFQGKKLNSLNDLTVDRDGNVYWTDPNGTSRENPTGKVFRVSPEGQVELLADDLAFPNGLDVDPANRFLYLVESQTAKILRYELPAAGKPLGRPEVFFALGGSGGDGCAFDAAGNLWAADFHRPDTKQGRITVLSPEAKELGHLAIPAGQVSNLTFGGPRYDELFVTTGEPPAVFRAAVGVVGFRGHPGRPMKAVRTLDLKPLDEPLPGR